MGTNNRQQTQQETFRRRGIKTGSNTREPLNFVGKNGKSTFLQMQDTMISRFTSSTDEVATLGEAYTSAVYLKDSTSIARTYEDVYGVVDFTEAVAADGTVRQILDEVYGNNDNDPTGEVSSLSVVEAKEAIGKGGATKSNLATLLETHKGLFRSQNGTAGSRDEDAPGIRGVADFNAPIDPIA